ncbi:MAG: hypothetical protein ABI867_03290 [Kofleriaceae bacterium]
MTIKHQNDFDQLVCECTTHEGEVIHVVIVEIEDGELVSVELESMVLPRIH